jgi:Uma2 family endonuclease
MRTVILGERPPAIEALIESRRRTGADRRDEIWDGDYHMNPAPRRPHGNLQAQLIYLLTPHARRQRLYVTSDFNVGVPNDYRIPDGGICRDNADVVYADTAALVIEVHSPDDETYEKLPFYAARRVDEVVIADPATRRLTWLRLAEGTYVETDRSALLDLDTADLAAQLDWP